MSFVKMALDFPNPTSPYYHTETRRHPELSDKYLITLRICVLYNFLKLYNSH